MKSKMSSNLKLFYIVLSCLVFVVLALCGTFLQRSKVSATTGIVPIETREQFAKALAQKQSTIYVGNIDFGNNIDAIEINYSIDIIGTKSLSILKNAHFFVAGSNTAQDCIKVTMKNLKFDGAFDKTSVDLSQDKSFSEIFGSTRPNTANTSYKALCLFNYYNLTLQNCHFTNYVSSIGPTIYSHTLDKKETSTHLTLTDCKFYGNICEVGTMWITESSLKLKMTNCEFFDNYARSIAGALLSHLNSEIENLNIHSNNYVAYSSTESKNSQQNRYGGGLFMGLSTATIKNSTIKDCTSQNGGGVAITNCDVTFENCKILNNKAIVAQGTTSSVKYVSGGYGGGIFVLSEETKGVVFKNCNIANNSSKYGASVCVMPVSNSTNAGTISFLFCNIGLNSAEDDNCFSCYNTSESQANTIELKGCFVVDNTTLTSNGNAPAYNYITTKEQALLDCVIDQNIVENANNNGLSLIKNSKADIAVPASDYSLWHKSYNTETSQKSIGTYEIMPAKTNKTSNNLTAILVPTISAFAILASIATLLLIKHKNKMRICLENNPKSAVNTNIEESTNQKFNNEEIETIVSNIAKQFDLSKKEIDVLKLALSGKQRKEIASQFYITEHTVKKHLSNIYSKLEISGKKELQQKAKTFLN